MEVSWWIMFISVLCTRSKSPGHQIEDEEYSDFEGKTSMNFNASLNIPSLKYPTCKRDFRVIDISEQFFIYSMGNFLRIMLEHCAFSEGMFWDPNQQEDSLRGQKNQWRKTQEGSQKQYYFNTVYCLNHILSKLHFIGLIKSKFPGLYPLDGYNAISDTKILHNIYFSLSVSSLPFNSLKICRDIWEFWQPGIKR